MSAIIDIKLGPGDRFNKSDKNGAHSSTRNNSAIQERFMTLCTIESQPSMIWHFGYFAPDSLERRYI
ncbi:unnamed protein product [Periconia digitata]|uniref:Uncharacterized protein n=1 Tax=Periconia digitata TaxID=1303443 RepID=A0A9W4XLX0_9PLEO|nr:unnamed protein product [Periconia digitata]